MSPRPRALLDVCLAAPRLTASLLIAPAATDYHVGPGQSLAAVGEVPWESLGPGDHVFIHYQPEPYHDKWVIGVSGTAAQPIVVSGVPGPGGELPLIDGRDATTREALAFTNQGRGVIKIGSADVPADILPEYIVIEQLEVRSGRPPFSFVGADGPGDSQDYGDNAAAIYVEKAAHLTWRPTPLASTWQRHSIWLRSPITRSIGSTSSTARARTARWWARSTSAPSSGAVRPTAPRRRDSSTTRATGAARPRVAWEPAIRPAVRRTTRVAAAVGPRARRRAQLRCGRR